MLSFVFTYKWFFKTFYIVVMTQCVININRLAWIYGVYLNFNSYRKQILSVYRNAWDESWDLQLSLKQIYVKGSGLQSVHLGHWVGSNSEIRLAYILIYKLAVDKYF